MPVYQVACRPHGQPDKNPSLTFLVDQIDYRSAWHRAMELCFHGGEVRSPEGGVQRLPPRRWTVSKLKPYAPEPEDAPGAPAGPDWPGPPRDLMDPRVRERELARLYAGRQYDSVRLRSRQQVSLKAAAAH